MAGDERHSTWATRYLNGIDFLADASEIVYAHYERWDGKGYPRGLKGDGNAAGRARVRRSGRYNAMTSRWPDRDAMSQDDALDEIM